MVAIRPPLRNLPHQEVPITVPRLKPQVLLQRGAPVTRRATSGPALRCRRRVPPVHHGPQSPPFWFLPAFSAVPVHTLMTYMHMYTVVYCRETERCVVVRVCRWFWMAVRFVCVIRVPVCARVSRACPVCVPAPPGVFLPVQNRNASL